MEFPQVQADGRSHRVTHSKRLRTSTVSPSESGSTFVSGSGLQSTWMSPFEGVAVEVAVLLGVSVGGVPVMVGVAVAVGVRVKVAVLVAVGVLVVVGVKVDVAVAVIVGVRVGVDVAALATFTRNSPAAQLLAIRGRQSPPRVPPAGLWSADDRRQRTSGHQCHDRRGRARRGSQIEPGGHRNVSPISIPPDATAVGVRDGGGDGVVPDTTSSRNSPAAHPVPSGVDNCHQVNRWQIVAHR